MSRKRKPEPDPMRQGLEQALREIGEAGGVVLVGHAGQPFAFYPPRLAQQVDDPGAPGRLREILRARRFEQIPDEELLFLALDPEMLAKEP